MTKQTPTTSEDLEIKRTLQQNKAMHLYFTQIAEALNDAGLDIKQVISHAKIDIPWTSGSVKELIWKTIQRSMFKKGSTTELTKLQEINKIHEVITRFLAKLGIEYIPFPSIETMEEELERSKSQTASGY